MDGPSCEERNSFASGAGVGTALCIPRNYIRLCGGTRI